MLQIAYGQSLRATVRIKNIGEAPGTFEVTGYVNWKADPNVIYTLEDSGGGYPRLTLLPAQASPDLNLITAPFDHLQPGSPQSTYRGVVTCRCIETGEIVNDIQDPIAQDVGQPKPGFVSSVVYSVA